MEKSLEKFFIYIQELQDKIINSKNQKILKNYFKIQDDSSLNLSQLENISNRLERFKRVITLSEEQIKKRGDIFGDYAILSIYLEAECFTPKDQLAIIKYFIKYNITSGIFKINEPLIDLKVLKKKKFEHSTYDEIIELIYNGKIEYYMNENDEGLTEEEVCKKEEIRKEIQSCYINIKKDVRYTRLFYNHYLKKENSLEEKDIHYILFALDKLGVSEKIVNNIKMYLNLIVQKNEKEDKNKKKSKKNRLPIIFFHRIKNI